MSDQVCVCCLSVRLSMSSECAVVFVFVVCRLTCYVQPEIKLPDSETDLASQKLNTSL